VVAYKAYKSASNLQFVIEAHAGISTSFV